MTRAKLSKAANAIAVKKVEQTSIATIEDPRRGFEEAADREDLVIPRAKLLQGLSDEIVDRLEGLEPGMIINSLTKEPLPDFFVPIFRFTNWARFNPRNKKDPNYNPNFASGALIWKSSDPHDPRVQKEAEWGPNGEAPLATKFLNFFSYFPGVPMPIVVSFSKSSFKAGKELNSLASYRGGDMFRYQYRLFPKQEKNDEGTYFVLKIRDCGHSADEDYKIAERWYKEFGPKKDVIQVHDETPDDIGGE